MAMNFDNILDRLRNRIWAPMSEMDAVDMIINSWVHEYIDDEEKELENLRAKYHEAEYSYADTGVTLKKYVTGNEGN